MTETQVPYETETEVPYTKTTGPVGLDLDEMPICPLRMAAWDIGHSTIKAHRSAAQESIKCLGEECAWWHRTARACTILSLTEVVNELPLRLSRLLQHDQH